MDSSDADLDDTPASSVHESDLEENAGEEEEDEVVPLVTVHPRFGHNVDAEFDCPLKEISKYTLAAAQESARKGCPQCILRFTATSETFPSLPDCAELQCSHSYLFIPFLIQGHRIVLASYDHAPTDDMLFCNVYGHRIGGLGCVERIVPCDTDSPGSLQTVKRWIKECDEGHDCTSNSKSDLPRRLLDVRNDSVRVHEITEADKGTKYACLSHCWGYPPNSILRSTLATFNDYRQAIPWEKLPKTFRDAISFTRKLGVPFLWIDSLCIVQDDKDKKDWHEQSANMANIYRNAYITLAATAAKDADGGLYTPHDHPVSHQIGSPILNVHFPDGTERQLFARRSFDHDVTSWPLLKRGWVYQERLLSPRVLHFVDEEVIWECNHAITCECGRENLEHAMERARITDSSRPNEFSCIGPHSWHPAPLDRWYQIVGEYCALSLTNPSDIYPALSGIAKFFAAEIEDDYIAGMWRRTLVSNLLWYFTGREPQPSKSEWRAPSWSWASSGHHSDFRVLPTTEELASVIEVTSQPSGVDLTGGLIAASLTLRTKAIPATFHSPTQTIQIGDLSIASAPENPTSYTIHDLCTAYFDLTSTSHTSILLAQLAKCTGQRRPYLHGVHEPILLDQEVRSYMILAPHNDKYTRIGLATIVAYDPNTSLYPTPCPDKRALLSTLTRAQIQARFEATAQLNRRTFEKFDGMQDKDLIIL